MVQQLFEKQTKIEMKRSDDRISSLTMEIAFLDR